MFDWWFLIDGWHADDADNADSFFTFLTTEYTEFHRVLFKFLFVILSEAKDLGNIHFSLYFSLSWYKEKVTKDYTLVLKI